MPLDPKVESSLFETIYESFQESASKLGAIYTPQWNVRNEIAKTLLTISTAVLVISISLSSRITAHRWILDICWSAFLLAIFFSVATLWLSLGLFSLPAFMVAVRTDLRKAVKDFDLEKLEEASGAIVNRLVINYLNKMEKLDRWALKTIEASLLLFVIGLFFTAIIGWTQ